MASMYPFPGVWTQRVERPQPAREISPSAMGIIGYTLKGPVNVATRIESWNEFQDMFGGLTDKSYVPMSVMQFYENGGQIVYVIRVVPSGSLTASATVDSPVKWTINSLFPGESGNDISVKISGNAAFLNRSTYAWDRFDIYILEPDDEGNLVASEFFEAVQFTDDAIASYITRVLSDPERGSAIVEFVKSLGGVPADLVSTVVEDESVGTGSPPTKRFYGTLVESPVLTSTLQIVAAESNISNQAQTTTPAINGTATTFTCTLPSIPVLDGSVKLFYQRDTVTNEYIVPTTGLINGTNRDFVFDAGVIDYPVHREATVFNLKYAKTAASSPEVVGTIGATAATFDLATATGPTDIPVHPGTVSIAVTMDVGGAQTITDDGAGALTGTGGCLPLGGTINYVTGDMTGVTATLQAYSDVIMTYNQSAIITKTVSTDNTAQDVALTGAIGVGGVNTIDLVNSVTAPTSSGIVDVKTFVAPIASSKFYVDYIALGIVNSNVDGDLSGDVGTGTNTVDFTTGDINVTCSDAPLTGSTLDANYSIGQIVTDNGLGFLVGDIDSSGTNTINYSTGAYDVTFSTAPPAGTSIYANYVKLQQDLQVDLAGGSDGTGIILRAQVSDPALEASKGGMYALKDVEDLFQIAIPDFCGVVEVSRDQLDFAEAIKRGFAVLGTPVGLTSAEAKQWRMNDLGVFSRWGACYYPWIYIRNPSTDLAELYPPIGTVCGVYARVDSKRNVGKSPAGTEDAYIRSAVGPEYVLGDSDLENIYESGMNALRSSLATGGFVVWGARTLERDNTDWYFVNAQRLFNFLEYSAYRLTQFLVFGNNGPALWKRAELALTGWLTSLFNQGYFAGNTPEQAFYVICDASNNNQATIESGVIYIDIGAAPFRPNEFVVVRLTQKVREQV